MDKKWEVLRERARQLGDPRLERAMDMLEQGDRRKAEPLPAQIVDAVVRDGPPWLLILLALACAAASLFCFAMAIALSKATHILVLFKWAGWAFGPLFALAAVGLAFAARRPTPRVPPPS